MRKNWSREELILAFNLYCKIPFGKINHKNHDIIRLASLIERTPSAVAFKLSNFASFDPYHQKRGVSGLKNAGKLDKEIYDEFSHNWYDLAFESEVLLNQKLGNESFEKQILQSESIILEKKGEDVLRLVKTRINQSFFRTVVLNIYSNRCAVSGIDLPELLVASHIVPWSENKNERLNPSNGICLSPLYDKAFDKGLMTLTDDLKIRFSKRLILNSEKAFCEKFFDCYEGKDLNMPEKFLPNHEFILFHRKNIFLD